MFSSLAMSSMRLRSSRIVGVSPRPKIQAKGGAWPNDQELADAFRGLTFPTPTSEITLRPDGQGLEDQIVGLSSFNDRFPFAVPDRMMLYPAADVSAPVGQKSTDWLKTLRPDMVQRVGRSI